MIHYFLLETEGNGASTISNCALSQV